MPSYDHYRYLIGVDPGKSTGMCLLHYTPHDAPTMAAYDTCTEESVTELLQQWQDTTRGEGAKVIVERFVLREGMYGVDLSPERINGRISEWANKGRIPVNWQLPAEKKFVSNDVLRRLALWSKGTEQRHVNDAARHSVNWLAKMRHLPTLQKGWP